MSLSDGEGEKVHSSGLGISWMLAEGQKPRGTDIGMPSVLSVVSFGAGGAICHHNSAEAIFSVSLRK